MKRSIRRNTVNSNMNVFLSYTLIKEREWTQSHYHASCSGDSSVWGIHRAECGLSVNETLPCSGWTSLVINIHPGHFTATWISTDWEKVIIYPKSRNFFLISLNTDVIKCNSLSSMGFTIQTISEWSRGRGSDARTSGLYWIIKQSRS